MAITFSRDQNRALMAKFLRDFADQIESGAVDVIESGTVVETTSYEADDQVVTVPTRVRVATIRYEINPRILNTFHPPAG